MPERFRRVRIARVGPVTLYVSSSAISERTSTAKGKLRVPSDAEQARIAAAIAADPDNPKWTAEDLRRAKPFPKMFPSPREDLMCTRVAKEADENAIRRFLWLM